MYDQIEDALTSITMQLRSAIEADAHRPPRANGKANGRPRRERARTLEEGSGRSPPTKKPGALSSPGFFI
jgi:hypothetical protein